MRRRFKEALKKAGLRALRFHDLRHTFATLMVAAGAPLRMVQEWMGHRDYKTTLIYADYAPNPVGAAQFTARAFEELQQRGSRIVSEGLSARQLQFGETLLALLGWMGETVEVVVGAAKGDPPVVIRCRGRLRGAADLGRYRTIRAMIDSGLWEP